MELLSVQPFIKLLIINATLEPKPPQCGIDSSIQLQHKKFPNSFIANQRKKGMEHVKKSSIFLNIPTPQR